MRKIFLYSIGSLFFLYFMGHCYAQDIQASSRISSVVVYPDAALISRSASLQLQKGEYSIYFSDIIPDVDENSIRVSGKGSAQTKIFGAQLKKEFLEKSPGEKVAELKDKIQELFDYIQGIKDEKEVLSNEREFLNSLRIFSGEQIPKDLVTKTPQILDLENTTKFLNEKLSNNYKKRLALEKEERQANKKLNVLQNELSQLTGSGGGSLVKRSIIVELESERAGTLELMVSYLVRGASWNMIYDARVAFKDKKVELISYGVVKQKTGEDWSDIDVSLSTVKPSISGRMPFISPWFLKPYERPISRVMGKLSADAARAASFAQYEAMAPLRESALEKKADEEAPFSFAESEQKGTAIVYNLSRKATIKSDGSEHKLPINSQALEADFEYSASPRISPFAYLGCRVTNSKEFQLLAGRVNVFLEGDYVGNSSIDNIGQGENFDLYLGVDEGVKIERKEIEKKVDETLFAGVSSSNKKTAFKYKLKAENYKSDKIKLSLFEPMPVSQDDRIVVKIGKASIQPNEKDWKDRKGVWKWELELSAQEKKEIYFDYIIEHPRNMEVTGL